MYSLQVPARDISATRHQQVKDQVPFGTRGVTLCHWQVYDEPYGEG